VVNRNYSNYGICYGYYTDVPRSVLY